MRTNQITFDWVFVAAGREPSGFATFIRHSPDGLRSSANKVSAISLARPSFGLDVLAQSFGKTF